jgi:hypothetical protein
MNYQITYDDAENFLVVTTAGKMNAVDFISMAKDLLKHPRCLPNCNVVFDHIALEFNHVPVGDLQKIREFHMHNEARIGSGKSAIIVKVGLSQDWNKLWSQGEKIKTGNRTRIFENLDAAICWLKEDNCIR